MMSSAHSSIRNREEFTSRSYSRGSVGSFGNMVLDEVPAFVVGILDPASCFPGTDSAVRANRRNSVGTIPRQRASSHGLAWLALRRPLWSLYPATAM